MPRLTLEIPLSQLAVGGKAIVQKIHTTGLMRRRMLDLGLVPGTKITVQRASPAGDPRAYEFRGSVIAFRHQEADNILVTLTCSGG